MAPKIAFYFVAGAALAFIAGAALALLLVC